jgi:hypothetical protein
MKRVLAALAVAALLTGCSLPASVTGEKAKDPGKVEPSISTDGQAPAQGSSSALPGDAGSLASMAQSLASQQSVAPTESPTTTPEGTYGGDISWPQCPPGMGIPQKKSSGQPMPLPDATFVIIGLTNGPGFVRNPCLRSQVQWAKIHRLRVAAYSVVSYPDAAALRQYGGTGPYDANTELGRLKNVGYQQATYNIGSMGTAGLDSPIVWLDVENVPDFDWPKNNAERNAAVVQGAARGYQDAGYDIGVYGTPTIWRAIVGGLSLGKDVPEWRAAGQTSAAEAAHRCDASWTIQGGRAVLGQWVEQRRDRNLVCPGVAGLDTWFHQA